MDDIGTDLYRDALRSDFGIEDGRELMRKVWSPTPWMVNAYVGDGDGPRERQIRDWVHEQFGPESQPLRSQAAQWRHGSVNLFGWRWFGFATRELMDRFVAAWPTPADAPEVPSKIEVPNG